MFEIHLGAKVYPTEDTENVRKAILNLFPEAEITIDENKIVASTLNMDYFIQRIGEQKIRDSTRVILMKSIRGSAIKFQLNKQAAFVGKVNFSQGDSILGDIEIHIKTDEPDKVIQLMTEVF